MKVVERLEQLLAEARAGEIVGLAVAAHYGGNGYGYIGSGPLVENSEIGIAASICLKRRFL